MNIETLLKVLKIRILVICSKLQSGGLRPDGLAAERGSRGKNQSKFSWSQPPDPAAAPPHLAIEERITSASTAPLGLLGARPSSTLLLLPRSVVR